VLLVAESYPASEIRAVSVSIVPTAAVTFTVKVTVPVSLTARLPRLHTTAPVPPTGGAVHVPALGVTLTKVLPVVTVSLTVTLVAGSGPLLTAVMV